MRIDYRSIAQRCFKTRPFKARFDFSLGVQQRAGYEACPWNMVALKTWLEAQDFHGLEAWRRLIMAVLARVSRTANSFEAGALIPS